MSECSEIFGKYRGKVENNVDPESRGRIQVSVPAVLGEGTLSWAMPCAPFAGSGVGFFAVPPTGASIWVEFEAGDPDYPIWSGGFWEMGEAPVTPALPATTVWKTNTCTVTVDDTPGTGGITLELASGAKVALNAEGIEINNGTGASVKLTGASVSVNSGALEVT